MSCIDCGRGFHEECKKCRKGKCHQEKIEAPSSLTLRSVGAPLKSPEDMKDPKSTGRKRAAMLYPLYRDKPCEWRGLKNCGGGVHPITGCMDGLQQARHHGPVKDTTTNDSGNIHRICHQCHNRWHTLNNPDYNEEQNRHLPHKPEKATAEDIMVGEFFWKDKKVINAGAD